MSQLVTAHYALVGHNGQSLITFRAILYFFHTIVANIIYCCKYYILLQIL